METVLAYTLIVIGIANLALFFAMRRRQIRSKRARVDLAPFEPVAASPLLAQPRTFVAELAPEAELDLALDLDLGPDELDAIIIALDYSHDLASIPFIGAAEDDDVTPVVTPLPMPVPPPDLEPIPELEPTEIMTRHPYDQMAV